MLNDIKAGFFSAKSLIRGGNKKTSIFIIFVLALIFVNLVFLPSLINGMMGLFVGFVQDYSYGNVIIEPSEDNNYIENVDNLLKKIRSINEVTATTRRIESGASLSYKQENVGATIIGILPNEEVGVSKYPYIVKYGEFLGDLSRDEILLGSMIAGVGPGSEIYDNLGGVKVGSLINVTYSNEITRTYKVKGIHEGTFELTDLNALIHLKELESVLGIENENKATSVIIRTKDESKESDVKKKIIDLGVKEEVFTWQEKAETLIKQALQSMGSIDIMSRIVSLIVGASLIFIIIYINILNRKKEIGILKAIGISPRSIRISYIFISLFYVGLGIIIGLILFFSLVFYFKANPIVFYETLEISPKIDFNLLIKSILIMVGMSVVAGFIPAWFVTRQDMLETIWGR